MWNSSQAEALFAFSKSKGLTAGSTLFGFAATASAKPEDYVSRRFKPAGSLPTSSTRRLTRELPERPRCTRPRRATSPAQLH